MKIALVSDLHGNAVGLDAVVRDLEGEPWDEVVCLGDVAQGGAQPATVVDRLDELRWPCVFGNSDEFLLTLRSDEYAGDAERERRALETAEWSRRQLGERRLALLRAYAPTVELDGAGRRVVCCHATPVSNEDVVLPDTARDDIEPLVHGIDVVACGHVHLQWLRRVGHALWLSVGSAGLAYEHVYPLEDVGFEPFAEYAALTAEDGKLRAEFRRVPFDVDEVLEAITSSGMPYAREFAARWRGTDQ